MVCYGCDRKLAMAYLVDGSELAMRCRCGRDVAIKGNRPAPPRTGKLTPDGSGGFTTDDRSE